jgi:nitroreductase
MEFLDVVNKRKAIRKYLSKPVPDDLIYKILEIVNLAPSAGNKQAYIIYVIKNKKLKKKIAQICNEQYFIDEAPVVFVFLAKPKESGQRYGKRGERLYAVQDATIAATYTILSATNFGLSTCWVGAFDSEVLKKELSTDLLPVAVTPLGYAAENPDRRARKNIDEIAKYLR